MGMSNALRKYKIQTLALTVCICTIYLLYLYSGNRHCRWRLQSRGKTGEQGLAKRKIILWWTPFFDGNDLYDQLLESTGPISLCNNCEFNCHFTTDRDLLNDSDAVLFHGRAWMPSAPGNKNSFVLLSDIPKLRLASQFWIFYLWENPLYTFWPQDAFNNFFNVTITYRRDSDIFVPNGRLIEHLPNETLEITGFAEKTKLVAWIVSNCNTTTTSKRETLVNELKTFLPIDVYGRCGSLKCTSDKGLSAYHTRFGNPCFSEIGSKYKFYLAFENGHCKDYVTEKFFNALAAGMVPVVYGGADYRLYAPESSFINAQDFKTVKELADYLLFLDKDPEQYLKYFEWRQQLKVDPVSFHTRAFCNLCERITTGNLKPRPAILDFKTWWWGENNSMCREELNLNSR